MIEHEAASCEDVVLMVSTTVGDPTTCPVHAAFTLPPAKPVDEDWTTAAWLSERGPFDTDYLATCLVGPGGAIELTVGLYDIYVKITSNPEIVIKKVGQLELS